MLHKVRLQHLTWSQHESCKQLDCNSSPNTVSTSQYTSMIPADGFLLVCTSTVAITTQLQNVQQFHAISYIMTSFTKTLVICHTLPPVCLLLSETAPLVADLQTTHLLPV